MAMRLALCVVALGVAACAPHEGKLPNYSIVGDSPYNQYRQTREAALTGKGQAPATIPITLPAKAPTAEEIAGGRKMSAVASTYRQGTRPAAKPDDLPVATSGPYPGTTPVLVRYAFAARHPIGQSVWPRQAGSQASAAKFCAAYPDAARAQTAFLAAGGPDKDPRGADPDGDGYVCGWDPAPYRVEQL